MSESSMIHHLVARNLKGPPTYAFNDRIFCPVLRFNLFGQGKVCLAFWSPNFVRASDLASHSYFLSGNYNVHPCFVKIGTVPR